MLYSMCVFQILYPRAELRNLAFWHYPDCGMCRYGAFDDYDEEDHILFQQNQGVGKKRVLYPVCFMPPVI